MKDLKKLIDNPFDALHDFRREVVQLFIYLHIIYMESQATEFPYLIPLIALSWTKYNNLFDITKDKENKISLRRGQRKLVVNELDNIVKAARTIEARVKDKVGKESIIYYELFPDGLSDYDHINLERAYNYIARLKDGTLKYETELGVDMKTLMIDVFNDFDEARRNQVDSAGSVVGNNPIYTEDLNIMNVQLYDNLHLICSANKLNIDVSKTFYNQTVLTRAVHHDTNSPNEPRIVSIQPESQIDTLTSFSITNTIILKNVGRFPLSFMTAFTADEPIHPNSPVLMPGMTVVLTPDKTGAPNNKFLIAANNETEEGRALNRRIVFRILK